MKIWVTKYALTTGIISSEAAEICEETPTMIVFPACGSVYARYFHGEGKDWHRTKEAAVARAEAMRVAKIASLRKSIAKLEKLKFE